MSSHHRKRKRGVILTPKGLNKVQTRIQELELKENNHKRFTLEQLNQKTDLDPHTICKILDRNLRVDQRSIRRFFSALSLSVELDDYLRPGSASEAREKNSREQAELGNNSGRSELEDSQTISGQNFSSSNNKKKYKKKLAVIFFAISNLHQTYLLFMGEIQNLKPYTDGL